MFRISRKARRATALAPVIIVFSLIALGVGIAVGSVVFQKSHTTLDGLRDDTFTAEANASIAGVATDFWSGVDLVRLLMIVIPAGAVIGALVFYLIGNMGGGGPG